MRNSPALATVLACALSCSAAEYAHNWVNTAGGEGEWHMYISKNYVTGTWFDFRNTADIGYGLDLRQSSDGHVGTFYTESAGFTTKPGKSGKPPRLTRNTNRCRFNYQSKALISDADTADAIMDVLYYAPADQKHATFDYNTCQVSSEKWTWLNFSLVQTFTDAERARGLGKQSSNPK
jgi:hypothetical protein